MADSDQLVALAERFGQNLRRIRKREDLSQERLAKGVSLHRTAIGLLERGERVCRIDTLIRLAGAMAIAPAELLEGVDWVPAPESVGTFVLGGAGSSGAAERWNGSRAATEKSIEPNQRDQAQKAPENR